MANNPIMMIDPLGDKEYKSEKSFEEAYANARKGYGKNNFKVNEYAVVQTYDLDEKQREALGLNKSTPAALFENKKNYFKDIIEF